MSGSSGSEVTACPSTAVQPTCRVTCPQTCAIPRQAGQALRGRPVPTGVAQLVFKRRTRNSPGGILPSALSPLSPRPAESSGGPRMGGSAGMQPGMTEIQAGRQQTLLQSQGHPGLRPHSPRLLQGWGCALGASKGLPSKEQTMDAHPRGNTAPSPPVPADELPALLPGFLLPLQPHRWLPAGSGSMDELIRSTPRMAQTQSCVPARLARTGGHGQHPVLHYWAVQEGLGQRHHVYHFPM